ncbi:MAG: FecR family protein [Woeseiaceae bacterium]
MNRQNATLALIAVFVLATPAHAQEAGSVTFVSGDVRAERQPIVTLMKGDSVLANDTIITGAASRAQLLMIDGAKIAIRPDSRIVIEEYAYAAAASGTGSATVSSSDDSSVIRLVKGGFRSITGAIGKENPSNYEVRTAVGVLGIRGTDFAVLFCSSDCGSAPGVSAGSPVPDGLYIMVTDGTIVFRNAVADIEVNAGEFVFIPLATRRPERLDATPPVFLDDSDLRFDPSADDDRPPTGFNSALAIRREPDGSESDSSDSDSSGQDGSSNGTPEQAIIGIDQDGNPVDLTPGSPPDPTNRSITYSSGPLGAADATFSGTLDNLPGQYQLDGGNNLTGFDNLYPTPIGPDIADFDIGSSANVETGFDTMTVMRWGRWSGGVATITLSDGSDASQDLGSQSLHWVSGPESAAPPVLPITGVANYSLIGATSPTDNLGNVGVLGDATFRADFTNMLVDSTLLININGFSWSATGNGSIGARAQLPAHLFQGLYGTVTITDGAGAVSSGRGAFSGFFSDPGPTSDPSYPGGVGLTYSLQDLGGTNVSVSGAAAFGNP